MMPIRPEYRWIYPIDWPQLSNTIRFKRAKGCCEHCGRPHGKTVHHLGDGRWWDEDRGTWRDGRGRVLASLPPVASMSNMVLRNTKVVLAAAHLDHDPSNNSSKNLRALCQRCHMEHDRPEHRRRRRITYRSRKAIADLFLGPYRL